MGNTEDEIVLAGQKILLTHGHFYKVKYSYDRLFYHAKGVRGNSRIVRAYAQAIL